MSRLFTVLFGAHLFLLGQGWVLGEGRERPLAHMVYFALKKDTSQSKQEFIRACREKLSGMDGIVYLGIGEIAGDLDRPINDRDYHISLLMVFRDRQAHDRYQTDPRHLELIAQTKDKVAKMRVFDSYLEHQEQNVPKK